MVSAKLLRQTQVHNGLFYFAVFSQVQTITGQLKPFQMECFFWKRACLPSGPNFFVWHFFFLMPLLTSMGKTYQCAPLPPMSRAYALCPSATICLIPIPLPCVTSFKKVPKLLQHFMTGNSLVNVSNIRYPQF